MSEHEGDKTTAKPTASAPPPAATKPQPSEATVLSELMAAPAAPAATGAAPRPPAPDLERDALRAAEQALLQGQRALDAARAQLGGDASVAPAPRSRRRELVLRGLLVFNVLAMLAVMSLPTPKPAGSGAPAPSPHSTAGEPAPTTPESRYREPWNRAMEAADRRDFGTAITILEQYLTPRMAPSEQLSVLMALAHYSARLGQFDRAQEFQRRADAIDKSHSLPEDLVAEAKAAAESGDQEALRRIWARFLLQERQVPSWLYKHVAEAYLQLGDSYRLQANAAAEQARLEELERLAEQLRGRAGGERAK
ncbi:MAG: hypothetical protein JNL08_02150 [Planctomycetes bacterium]|nr:hypothetical protein [Planctomycetota bacterium]